MEQYELILKHQSVDENANVEDIEEPYIVKFRINTLVDSVEYDKKIIIVEMCDKLVKFITGEENV